MDELERSQIEVRIGRDRLNVLQTVVLVQQRLLMVTVLLAILIAPLTAVADQRDTNDPTSNPRGLFDSIGYFFEARAEMFGSRRTYPNRLDGGLIMTRTGIVLLLITVLCTLIVIFAMWAGHVRGMRPALMTLGIALIATTGITFLGLTWLPDDDLATNATGWMALPIASGAWALYHVWSLKRLD